MAGVENNCKCHNIYNEHGHIKRRARNERLLGSEGQFCAAFYHVHQWYHRQEGRYRKHFCLDENKCIVAQEAKERLEKDANDRYAWCVQVKTVVAVVKFEDENGILYEGRYTNCGEKKKHAEDFFKHDIEKGELRKLVQNNPNGTIILYLTIQPCNMSTSETGTENTNPDQSCCDILKTIVKQTLQNDSCNINLYIKATNTNRLRQTDKNPTLRDNAVNGIKNLMGFEGVNVSRMTREDWHYLLSLTNELENREDLEVHEDRQDLDASVQHIFNEINQA